MLSSGGGASSQITRSFFPSEAGSTTRPRHVRATAPATAGKRNIAPRRQRVASCGCFLQHTRELRVSANLTGALKWRHLGS